MSIDSPSNDPGVFLSYRRADVPYAADMIAERLRKRFGTDSVFLDIASIAPGEDWPKALDRALHRSEALLAVIGPRWLMHQNASGSRALDDPQDPVRAEVRTALDRRVWVCPVLIEGAKMPSKAELPPDLGGLSDKQAPAISRDRFDADLAPVLDCIDSHVRFVGPVWARAAAFVIDFAITVLLTLLLGRSFNAWFFLLVFTVYHAVLVGMLGRTVGKLLLGLRIELPREDLPTRILRVLLRPTIGYGITLLPLTALFGLVLFLLHKEHSTFHDFLFDTKVLRDRKSAWRLPRRLNDLSYEFDLWAQLKLSRPGLLAHMISYLVTARFGLNWMLTAATRGYQAVATRIGQALAKRAAASAQQVGTGSAPGAATAAEPVAGAVTPVASTGSDAALALKGLGMAFMKMLPSIFVATLLTVGGLWIYESIAPRPLKLFGGAPTARTSGGGAVTAPQTPSAGPGSGGAGVPR